MPRHAPDETQALTLTREVEELELIFTSMLAVGVPFDAPDDFKARVLAAANSYVMGNKSVDYQLRRYGDDFLCERPSREERTMFKALLAAKRHVEELADRLRKFPPISVSSGCFAAEACLLRLTVSFKSAVLLIRQGFVFEAGAICRLILEQLAWAYAIHKIEDDSFFLVEPNGCITELKKLLPASGRFYGSLSNLAHVHPRKTAEYLEFQGPQTAVLLSIAHLRWAAVFDLLTLADWYHVVGEYVVFNHLDSPTSIQQDKNGVLIVVPDRPFVKEILAHAKKGISVGAPITIDS